MNILHTETLYNWGGQQNKVINEMVLSRELGHNAMLFCNPNSQISEVAKEKGFEVFECKMSKKTYHKSIPVLCKIIKDKNINLVITNGSTDSWVGAIAGVFYRKKGVKFARERHNQFPIKSNISKFMHKRLFDKIISVSPPICAYLKDIGVDENKIFYMPTTVDFNDLNSSNSTFKQEFNIPKEAITVGMFSALYKKKGVYEFADSLKKAMTENENIWGVFGGGIKDNVKEEILSGFQKDLRNKIIFTGFRKDVANIIKGIEIFVFPSHTEGLPTALLEAMALSRPIVAFDIEPMNLLLKDRGVCVKFKDTDALTKAINLYTKDKNLAKQNGKNASMFVKQNYDIQTAKDNIKKFLESL
ncbi:glycosyltransferase family 4 protein [Campylobacter sp. CCUG 57310]|uniref:glycosyltransferase family 4 protein n=1 Tax=Campylobacter sp. CCUG 57310 TaxID=2517362 RepID=UPI0015669188|nr:glycosyltransferase family 4 protein [Campylobacter sp. CCUG 57310]QKF91699.1 glycosyltransferase, family 1 [Campylobacter sp. CCUG 57310]